MRLLSVYFLAAFIFCSCCSSAKLGVKQGIQGYVYLVSGNQMPSPDIKKTPSKGIRTTIYIYELTNISQVVQQGQQPFYSAVNSRFIQDVQSNEDGSFKVSLPPGKYSLFTKKDTLFYANRFDEVNNISPVEVLPKEVTSIEIKMDYNAFY